MRPSNMLCTFLICFISFSLAYGDFSSFPFVNGHPQAAEPLNNKGAYLKGKEGATPKSNAFAAEGNPALMLPLGLARLILKAINQQPLLEQQQFPSQLSGQALEPEESQPMMVDGKVEQSGPSFRQLSAMTSLNKNEKKAESNGLRVNWKEIFNWVIRLVMNVVMGLAQKLLFGEGRQSKYFIQGM